jgi:beta-glucosidase
VVSEIGDLCRDWVTINEPNVYTAMGYQLGEFPPGQKAITSSLKVLVNLCHAHARAYHAIHELQPRAQVGWAQHLVAFAPGRASSKLDHFACWVYEELFNRSFVRMIEDGAAPFPYNLFAGDLSDARDTLDFIGINVYSRAHVSFDIRSTTSLFCRMFIPDDAPQGDSGAHAPYGEAYPQSIRLGVEYMRRLNKPIYILENGVPDATDRIRPWLLSSAVEEVEALIENGNDVRGYFHWSLVDNFEWAEGWGLRFGLFHLDPTTQERTLRPSGKLYAEIISKSRNGFGSHKSQDQSQDQSQHQSKT